MNNIILTKEQSHYLEDILYKEMEGNRKEIATWNRLNKDKSIQEGAIAHYNDNIQDIKDLINILLNARPYKPND